MYANSIVEQPEKQYPIFQFDLKQTTIRTTMEYLVETEKMWYEFSGKKNKIRTSFERNESGGVSIYQAPSNLKEEGRLMRTNPKTCS